MNIQKIVYSTRGFLHRNGSTILTVVGICGGVYAAVKAVKDTPKAIELLAKAKEPDDFGTMNNYLEEEGFTKWDAIKTVAPIYILPVAIGISSIACLLGASVLSRRQQAALIGAYALVDAKFKEYRESAKRVYGEDADQKITDDILIAEHYDDVTLPSGDLMLFYDSMSDRYFHSTSQNVMESESELNRLFVLRGYASLNDFYKMLGLPETLSGDILGWDAYHGPEDFGYNWVDFVHREEHLEDGSVCYAIIAPFEPHIMFDERDDETDEYTRH